MAQLEEWIHSAEGVFKCNDPYSLGGEFTTRHDNHKARYRVTVESEAYLTDAWGAKKSNESGRPVVGGQVIHANGQTEPSSSTFLFWKDETRPA